jgi:hypothetical protein
MVGYSKSKAQLAVFIQFVPPQPHMKVKMISIKELKIYTR